MNLKTRPLLMAAGAGIVVQIIFLSINLGVGVTPYLIGSNPLEYRTLVQGVGSLICLCLLIFDVGVGFLYAYLGSRESALTAGNGAVGGAAAGLIARLVSTLVNSCLGLLIVPALIGQAAESGLPGATGVGFGTGVAAVVLSTVLSLCLFLVFGGIFGAVGGAIGSATVGKGRPPAPSL